MGFISVLSLMLMVVCLVNKAQVDAQQPYVNNKQLDCYNTAFNYTTKGYQCNGQQQSCQSYLTFRSSPPYNTPVSIAYLLSAQDSTSLIATLNNLSSDVASIPTDLPVIIPVNCSCHANRYYQHNASYILKSTPAPETYFSVANNTYQGLTTCQALMDQNPYGDRNLSVGLRLQVPLRCACPTSNQTTLGFKYLLTYMVDWGDSLSAIAQLFGVDLQNLLDANKLSTTSIIFPFTSILVPLTKPPTKITPVTAQSPPPQAPPSQESDSSTNNKWIYVGVGLGVAVLVVLGLLGFLFWYRNSRSKSHSHHSKPISISEEPRKLQSESAIPDSKSSWSLSSNGVRNTIESLTVYKFHDIEMATGCFSQDNKIKGSVYKGSFKGDPAAVKVMMGDVSSEINILKKINHSNIIRLSGFCVHEGNTYLVYEFAENGALSHWLRSDNNSYKIQTLTWKQRVQIAHDIANALNYLHNYTNPPYIHKNLNSSNILLDANLRAKIANFGLARSLDSEQGKGGLQLTRHVVGTQGYMAPEYIENGVITPKLDVFAFGVVMLELLSGKEAASGKNTKELLSATINKVLDGHNVREKLHDFMDISLENEYPLELAFSLAQLAKTCVALDRPSMSQVFITLSKILSSSLDWDPSLDLEHSSSISSSR